MSPRRTGGNRWRIGRHNAVVATPDTVIIFTTRMRELAEFYRAGLGLGDPMHQSDAHIGFQLDNLYLGFDQVEEPVADGSNTTLWFRVADLAATFGRLLEMGAAVRYAPTDTDFGETLASVYDLDGNIVGLSREA